MEDINLTWDLFAAPFWSLAILAVIRAIYCREIFNTFPWEIETDNLKAKKACILCIAITLFMLVVVQVISGMYFYAVGGLGFAIMLALIEAYIFMITGLAFMYLVQGLSILVMSFLHLFYMIACYFKNE